MKETLHTSWPRDVRLAVPAGAVSVAGDAMAMVALTLRIHSTGDGPYAVAVLLACFSLPVVLTMGVAGSLSDRADPRLVLGVGGAVQVLAAAGLATWHSVPATLALVLLLQTGFAFTNPVWSSVLTRAVGDERVGGLVSTQHALAAIAAPVGAALGGVLVQLHGDPVVFVLDALTYLVLVAVGVSLRMRSEPSLGIGGGARAGRVARVLGGVFPRAGLDVIRGELVVWVLVRALLPFVVTLEGMNTVEVFLLRDVLGASEAQFGLAQAVTGAGAVVGAGLAGLMASDTARLRAVVACVAAMSSAQVGQGLAPGLGVFLGFAVVLGLTNATSNAAIIAVLVRRVPACDRGKAMAVVNGLARSCTMLALALGGVAATVLGPRPSFVVAGTLGIAVAGWAWWSLQRVGALSGARP